MVDAIEAVFCRRGERRELLKVRNVSIIDNIRPSAIGARNPSDRVMR